MGVEYQYEIMDTIRSEIGEDEIVFSLKGKEYLKEDFQGKHKGYENWLILTNERTLLIENNEVIMNADTSKCEAQCKKGLLFYDDLIFRRTSSVYKIQFEKSKRKMVEKAIEIIMENGSIPLPPLTII